MQRLLLLALTLLCPLAAAAREARPDPAPVRTTPFPDVPRDHWAFDAVEQLRELGIVRGYPPAQTFQPRKRTAAPAKPGRAPGRRVPGES